jgi:hypothetical protein
LPAARRRRAAGRYPRRKRPWHARGRSGTIPPVQSGAAWRGARARAAAAQTGRRRARMHPEAAPRLRSERAPRAAGGGGRRRARAPLDARAGRHERAGRAAARGHRGAMTSGPFPRPRPRPITFLKSPRVALRGTATPSRPPARPAGRPDRTRVVAPDPPARAANNIKIAALTLGSARGAHCPQRVRRAGAVCARRQSGAGSGMGAPRARYGLLERPRTRLDAAGPAPGASAPRTTGESVASAA